MAPAHHHDHANVAADRFFALGICAALGVICILLWLNAYVWPPDASEPTMLNLLLAPRFHAYVLAGGIGLLALALLRGLGWWTDRKHVCTEPHGECGHAHGDHKHGSAPWRYAVLVLPVVLYSLGLPNRGLTSGPIDPKIDESEALVKIKNPRSVRYLDFLELKQAGGEVREELEGAIGHMKGHFIPGRQERVFGLGRWIIDCCGADARLVIGAVVATPEPLRHIRPNDWIEVEGVIQFVKRTDSKGILPVLRVQSMDKITNSTPERNPYLQ